MVVCIKYKRFTLIARHKNIFIYLLLLKLLSYGKNAIHSLHVSPVLNISWYVNVTVLNVICSNLVRFAQIVHLHELKPFYNWSLRWLRNAFNDPTIIS